jgi:hypothetical protein
MPLGEITPEVVAEFRAKLDRADSLLLIYRAGLGGVPRRVLASSVAITRATDRRAGVDLGAQAHAATGGVPNRSAGVSVLPRGIRFRKARSLISWRSKLSAKPLHSKRSTPDAEQGRPRQVVRLEDRSSPRRRPSTPPLRGRMRRRRAARHCGRTSTCAHRGPQGSRGEARHPAPQSERRPSPISPSQARPSPSSGRPAPIVLMVSWNLSQRRRTTRCHVRTWASLTASEESPHNPGYTPLNSPPGVCTSRRLPSTSCALRGGLRMDLQCGC